jgi:membrane protein YqaA with SNARE-associated domain
MLKSLYDWVMRLSGSRHAQWALACIAFAESSFFPVPPDVMLAPMVLARPERAWRYAAICAGASVAGGMLGYLIGFALEPVGVAILSFFGDAGGVPTLKHNFDKYGVAVILIQGLLPIPYKLLTIASGLAHFTFWQFVAASTAVRSARFFGVAFLVKRFGPGLLPVLEKRLKLVGGLVVLVVVAVVIGVKVLK